MRKLLLFILLCGLLYGQELTLSQKQAEVRELVSTVGKIEARLLEIAENPSKLAQEKVQRLDKVLKSLPDRQPTKPGRVTMKQHLQSVKAEIEKEPAKYITKEVERLINVRDKVNADIQVKQKEINDEKIK